MLSPDKRQPGALSALDSTTAEDQLGPDNAFAAAQAAYLSGADREAVRLCWHAREELDRAVDPRPELHVRIVHLMLIAAQRWWRGPDGSSAMPVRALVDEALSIADQEGDPLLQSLARQAQGAYFIAMRGLPDAIGALTEAVRYARMSGDIVTQIDALSELGHHTAGVDLARTLTLLNEAYQLVLRMPRDDTSDRAYLIRSGRVAGFLGVAHFDAGNFDEGERWLRQALADLDSAGIVDQFLMISNYLGQLLIAAGRYDDGRHTLREALDRTPNEADASMHLGYNLALLGKLELEAGRPGAAEEPIMAGWRHLQETQHASVRPIVRNYLAELLIHPLYAGRDLVAAADLLIETAKECHHSGFRRSELAALALHATVALEQGEKLVALALSEQAAAGLDQAGTLPALRSEEIYLVRHNALRAGSYDSDEADRSLRRAWEILCTKASTVDDPRRRQIFYTQVPVSVAIIDAGRRYLAMPAPDPADGCRS